MENDELNPGQSATELELGGAPKGDDPQGGDALDEIQDVKALRIIAASLPAFNKEQKDKLEVITDPDALRAEVKKIRSIGQRNEKKRTETPPPAAPVTPPPGDEPLKRSDFERSNEIKAIHMATGKIPVDPQMLGCSTPEELAQVQQEILDNWELIRNNYDPRTGRETPEQVLRGILRGRTIWKSEGGATKKKDNPAAPLQTTSGAPGSGGAAPTPAPGASVGPKKPEEWYPKKS